MVFGAVGMDGCGGVPVPPLSEFLGTHQCYKNAKLGALLSIFRMSLKFEKRGVMLA